LLGLCLGSAELLPLLAEELSSIAAVRALTLAEADERRPVRVRGVVTYYNPIQKVDLVLQDGENGIFAETHDLDFAPSPGDLVEVSAVTASGVFAQNLHVKEATIIGRSALPSPRRASFEELASGALDCVFVETSGIVRQAWVDRDKKPERLMLEVASAGQRFSIWVLNFGPGIGRAPRRRRSHDSRRLLSSLQ
jgi:hypothetical protein